MSKPTGAICNLDCEYCFFLSKDHLYPGSGFRMDEPVHAAYIQQLLAAHTGEPEAIDGPRAMHDAFRVDKGGKPTFDRVMAGLETLQRHGVEWNALTTVNAANGDHGREVYCFLRDELGARFIQFIPIVERVTPELLAATTEGWGTGKRPLYTQSGDQVTHRSVAPDQYGRFLIDVFEDWARHDIGDVFVQMFDTALAHWLGMDQVGLCVHAPTCGDAVALEHNGDLYSCDHFVEPDYLLGNITGGRTLLQMVDSPQQRAFGQATLDTLTQYCLACDVRFACNGGCPKDRFATAPTGEPGLHYLCPSYKSFFSHIAEPMQVMADLLRADRDAQGVRDWYAAADAQRSHNDSCSCGGGRKWKKCHGVPAAIVGDQSLSTAD